MSNPLIARRDAFLADRPEQREIVHGREWGVIRAGEQGPALVLLPGTLGRADIFWQQVEALSDRARILSVSYPVSGGLGDWVKDIAELMDRSGMEGALVLGSSLGGYVAQYFAGVLPERAVGLVAANTLSSVALIGGIPPYSLDLATAPAEALRGGFVRGLSAAVEADPSRRALTQLLLAEVETRIPLEELRSRLSALKHAPELPLAGISREVIAVVESEDDPLIPPPMRDAVRERLLPSRVYRFTRGGHFPYVERPADYTALLEERLGLATLGDHWPRGSVAEL
ncbi:MAG: alpha/beta hydrolase [Sphingomonadales bacterium]|nr:alpha/beta hydrolase [Sphingomonadales bacterium]MDE2568842.1 alpha/beta hydrolase [Sphingomonadales bacterium]